MGYRVGAGYKTENGVTEKNNGSTEADLTKKSINPVGGFPHYGEVKNDFLMIKGSCMGVRKRAIVLRKPLITHTKRKDLEEITLKFIDTTSKIGRSVPDYRGEEELHGSSQEATRSCFGCRVNLDGALVKKLISILKKNLKSFVFS